MNTAWCGVERGSASSTSPPVTAPAARDHVAVPRATAAPGSRLDRPLTLPPPSTKSAISLHPYGVRGDDVTKKRVRRT